MSAVGTTKSHSVLRKRLQEPVAGRPQRLTKSCPSALEEKAQQPCPDPTPGRGVLGTGHCQGRAIVTGQCVTVKSQTAATAVSSCTGWGEGSSTGACTTIPGEDTRAFQKDPVLSGRGPEGQGEAVGVPTPHPGSQVVLSQPEWFPGPL